MPLISLGVAVAFQIAIRNARPIGEDERLVDLLPLRAERHVHFLRRLDRLDELRALGAEHTADGILAVCLGVLRPIAYHRCSFAATSRSAE